MRPQVPEPESPRLRATLVYLVHGDGAYGFHDATGKKRQADAEAMTRAVETARRAEQAEVFIFRQGRPRFGWFGSDGTLLHYRGGKRMREVRYRRGRDFETEANLFSKHAAHSFAEACAMGAEPGKPPAYLFYFGHEIPAVALSGGLRRFARPCLAAKPFALIALSSCRGGTPETVKALAPFADYVLASPGDLHLSYLDPRSVARHAGAPPAVVGKAIAEESFARLQATTSTQITLSLYDTRTAVSYLEARRASWDPVEAAAEAGREFRDCAEIPAFGSGGAEAGVLVFHRPPRFGAGKGKASHSGWECATGKDERPGR